MDKQLIQDIRDLMNVVNGRADMGISARFSENGLTQFDAENLLREKLNSLYDPSDFYAPDSNKKACFALIAESVEKELPKRVEKQFDIYKAKMESLLISQLELIKDMKKDQ